jgi:predicted lipid carrier protein YhbT
LATKEQVQAKLTELIERLDEASGGVHESLAEALPDARVIEVHVADIDERFWTEMANGRLGKVREGRPERADIRVRLDSDDLVDLVEGKTSLFSRYLGGHVRIDASVSDLLRLRRLAG